MKPLSFFSQDAKYNGYSHHRCLIFQSSSSHLHYIILLYTFHPESVQSVHNQCTISAPLYAAFNQHKVVHHFSRTLATSNTTASQCCDALFERHCHCGVDDKKSKEHVTKMRKYNMHTMFTFTSQSTLHRFLP